MISKAGPPLAQLWRVQKVQKVQALQKLPPHLTRDRPPPSPKPHTKFKQLPIGGTCPKPAPYSDTGLVGIILGARASRPLILNDLCPGTHTAPYVEITTKRPNKS